PVAHDPKVSGLDLHHCRAASRSCAQPEVHCDAIAALMEFLRLEDQFLERLEEGLDVLPGLLPAAAHAGAEASIRRLELEVRVRVAEELRPVLAIDRLVLGEDHLDGWLRRPHPYLR